MTVMSSVCDIPSMQQSHTESHSNAWVAYEYNNVRDSFIPIMQALCYVSWIFRVLSELFPNLWQAFDEMMNRGPDHYNIFWCHVHNNNTLQWNWFKETRCTGISLVNAYTDTSVVKFDEESHVQDAFNDYGNCGCCCRCILCSNSSSSEQHLAHRVNNFIDENLTKALSVYWNVLRRPVGLYMVGSSLEIHRLAQWHKNGLAKWQLMCTCRYLYLMQELTLTLTHVQWLSNHDMLCTHTKGTPVPLK